MNNEWIKLTLRGKKEDEELLCAMMSMVANGLMIEDYSDVTTDGLYGALIDEAILNADKTHIAVSVFLPAEENPFPDLPPRLEALAPAAINS